jgi:hypothetical protein
MSLIDVTKNDSQNTIRYLLEQGKTFQLVICILSRGVIISRRFGDEHAATNDKKTCLILTNELPLMVLDGNSSNISFHAWVNKGTNDIDSGIPIDPFCTASIHKYTILFHQPITCAHHKMKLFNTLLLLKKMAGCIPITPVTLPTDKTINMILKFLPDKPKRRHSTTSVDTYTINKTVEFIAFQAREESNVISDHQIQHNP